MLVAALMVSRSAWWTKCRFYNTNRNAFKLCFILLNSFHSSISARPSFCRHFVLFVNDDVEALQMFCIGVSAGSTAGRFGKTWWTTKAFRPVTVILQAVSFLTVTADVQNSPSKFARLWWFDLGQGFQLLVLGSCLFVSLVGGFRVGLSLVA